MEFKWHGKMTEEPVHMVLSLPDVPLSGCSCSFCICVYGMKDKLEERDKELFQRHLIIRHGLHFYGDDELV